MAEVFVELLHVLNSRKEKLTPEEQKVFQTCIHKARAEFIVGNVVGGCATLAATWKLKTRFYISGGAAILYGLQRLNRSLNSCVDHLLNLDGSRLQGVLANIVVNKHQDDPWLMKQMARRFYPEKVFDDSSSDKPNLRWRYRNFSGDNVAYGQATNDSETQSDLLSHNDSDSKKAHVESKQVPMNPSADLMEDPLDGIFGCIAPVEEIHHPSTSSTPAKPLSRNHRRSRRRRRILHRESLGLNQVQPQQI
ncbi:hypothetical protein JCGZ_02187 [Jatropha curcas]|uniref:Uncharacterized protein n=1 Tax=Jatropha curcas TaxID=180498 RepID=A0A067L7Z0_JATCU|nr:uncharacterized protein LOC105632002 [Jatropha curcas]KDP40189.1 hypothetical protein JCGZ_02187 [Jatropha curcas]